MNIFKWFKRTSADKKPATKTPAAAKPKKPPKTPHELMNERIEAMGIRGEK